ncbi:MAG: hypothetical protein GXO69_00595 [Acidobacteria bacterium]|nr:hypothetical protein [Acidobacteriota bacterium]
MAGRLFGTDGIRGKSGKFPILPELAFKAGIAFAAHHPGKRILIAMDTRESGPALAGAVYAGLSVGGANPVHGGILPTPVLACSVSNMDFSGGVMITASHNPYTDNGLKFFAGDGRKISPKLENDLEKEILNENIVQNINKVSPPPNHNSLSGETLLNHYLEHLHPLFPPRTADMWIPMDCANGAGAELLHFVNRSLGAPIELLNAWPNGQNINLNCGAAQPDKMKANSAALDGDGDRILFKDSRERLITGDHIIMFLADSLNLKSIVGTVMTNQAVAQFAADKNIPFYRSDVGDRFVRELMDKHGAPLGGETSGHIILDKLNVTGDGFAVYLQVMALLAKENITLADIFDRYPMMPQTLLNLPVSERIPFENIPGFPELLRKTEEKLGKTGRIFPRYSGTENLLRILIESYSEEQNEEIASEISDFFNNRRIQ